MEWTSGDLPNTKMELSVVLEITSAVSNFKHLVRTAVKTPNEMILV